MGSSKRSTTSAPIDIPSSSNTSSSSTSYERGRTGYFDSIASKGRTNSYSSDISNPESQPSSLPKSSGSWKQPKVNVYTHCGRHTNQLLFGGPSLSELARAMLRKN